MSATRLDSLRGDVTKRLIERGWRIGRGFCIGGLIISATMAIPAMIQVWRYVEINSYSEFMPDSEVPYLVGAYLFFPVMNVLFFGAFAWLYYARNVLIAGRGEFLLGRLIDTRRRFGSDLLPTDHGPTDILAAGVAMEVGARVMEKVLPTEQAGFELTVNDRTHLFDMPLFGEEHPIVVDEGILLCFVDTGRFWFYPPSPFVVRVSETDPGASEFRQRTEAVVAELLQGAEHEPVTDKEAVRHSVRNQWFAIGAIVVVLLASYLPVIAIFGWPMALLLAFIIFGAIAAGLFIHKPRS